jgi:hypothetical protein
MFTLGDPSCMFTSAKNFSQVANSNSFKKTLLLQLGKGHKSTTEGK